jgi:hypothetical protein
MRPCYALFVLSVEVADRRLRGVRAQPKILEAAFRLAIREAIFVRPSADFGSVLQRRAEFHLARCLDSLSPTNDRAKLLLMIENVTRRFSRSRLCVRLLRVPLERVHAPDTAIADLIVTGCADGSYAIRFVASPSLRELGIATNAPLLAPAAVDGLLVYDLRTARVRRYDAARTSRLLCA